VISKLTVTTTGADPHIVDQPPILSHSLELRSEESVRRFYETYRTTVRNDVRLLLQGFRLVDVARKVVGVGSVGTRCYIALLLDRNDDPLFLQIKEAERSVLESHWKPTTVERQGERVVEGQQIMQAASDVFLGWASDEQGRDFYVRQFKDMKGSVEISALSESALREYLQLCGWPWPGHTHSLALRRRSRSISAMASSLTKPSRRSPGPMGIKTLWTTKAWLMRSGREIRRHTHSGTALVPGWSD
jgi:hypothetical protein